jgi:transposase
MGSTMQGNKGQKRARRSFNEEFKAEAVRLVLDEGKTVAQAARDLDLTETAFRKWVEKARSGKRRGKQKIDGDARDDELNRLRKENRQLQMERDILKKAAAFFAKESN